MLLLALIALLGLTIASPTPTNLVPRCGTTMEPTILQSVSEQNAFTVSGAGQSFSVGRHSSSINGLQRGSTVVVFTSIPSTATGCSLDVIFPASYSISSSTKNAQINVFTFTPPTLTTPNDWSWNKIYNPNTPQSYKGMSLFGTVTFVPGMKQTINSMPCSENMGFLFEVADWVTGDVEVQFAQASMKVQGEVAGLVLTHSC